MHERALHVPLSQFDFIYGKLTRVLFSLFIPNFYPGLATPFADDPLSELKLPFYSL
jgi:hypothetical protein